MDLTWRDKVGTGDAHTPQEDSIFSDRLQDLIIGGSEFGEIVPETIREEEVINILEQTLNKGERVFFGSF